MKQGLDLMISMIKLRHSSLNSQVLKRKILRLNILMICFRKIMLTNQVGQALIQFLSMKNSYTLKMRELIASISNSSKDKSEYTLNIYLIQDAILTKVFIIVLSKYVTTPILRVELTFSLRNKEFQNRLNIFKQPKKIIESRPDTPIST